MSYHEINETCRCGATFQFTQTTESLFSELDTAHKAFLAAHKVCLDPVDLGMAFQTPVGAQIAEESE